MQPAIFQFKVFNHYNLGQIHSYLQGNYPDLPADFNGLTATNKGDAGKIILISNSGETMQVSDATYKAIHTHLANAIAIHG